ncbi:MAG: DUF58 domain-containing protein [Ilumatobacter sp.]|nr:DUF58 domain-containing protein [Ilumatobacter sp.]
MLTRSGLGAAIAAVVLVICGFWWRYEELVVAGIAISGALAVAVWSARASMNLEITRSVASPRVARGDPIRAVYRAVNPGRRRVAPMTIVDQCDDQTVLVPLASIAADDRTEGIGLIPTRRRGVFEIGPWSIERVDPLGLSVGRRISESRSPIIVHPRVHPLTGPYGAMHTVEDEAVVRSAASDPLSGFVSLREYVDGDDPRLIHWPTSARLGTLMLREHVELRRPEFTVVLDAVDEVANADDFEEMVDVTASVAVHAISSGVTVRLRTTAREFPGSPRPLDRETQVLDLLTPVRPCERDQSFALAEVFHGGVDHTMIVLVTGPNGPSTTLAKTDKLSVIRIGENAKRAAGVVLAAADAHEFVQRWRPWI